MIRASIDIGSNSVLLLAAELDENNQIVKELLNLSHVTSLGRDLDKTKMFHVESMKATYEALSDYKNQLASINILPQEVIVTATEASRVASNASDFFKKVKSELGFLVIKISSVGEAHYTAKGVASVALESSASDIVIMDIGGASTELIRVELNPFAIISSISLPVGSVRATDWKKENSFEEKMNEIFKNDLTFYETKTLICVAGTMTSLASMYLGHKIFQDNLIDNFIISFQSFQRFSADLQKTNIDNLNLLFPFLGKRAPMLAAGSLVAEMIGVKLKIEKLQISTKGLRYGVLLQGEIDEQFITN